MEKNGKRPIAGTRLITVLKRMKACFYYLERLSRRGKDGGLIEVLLEQGVLKAAPSPGGKRWRRCGTTSTAEGFEVDDVIDDEEHSLYELEVDASARAGCEDQGQPAADLHRWNTATCSRSARSWPTSGHRPS